MAAVDVSIIVVSYNTRELTLECLRSVYRETRDVAFEVLVVDNDSTDGSAEAIASEFPQIALDAKKVNLGFGGACNRAAREARGKYLLMLNPDTVILDGAVQKMVRFAESNPEARLYGGRTLWEDGSLNPTSCWRRPTIWSLFCRAVGLSAVMHDTILFDPESYGSWQRDDVREIDIVTGCLMLIDRNLWRKLEGFDPIFFQRGEDFDFSLRAIAAGHRALHCPDATIIHYGSRAETDVPEKLVRNLLAKQRSFDRHWSHGWARAAHVLLRVWVLRSLLMWRLAGLLGSSSSAAKALAYREVWARRDEWTAA